MYAMDIVFFGSSNFSLPFLEGILTSRHHILAVVTQPDRPKGRHLKVSHTPVKELALENNLKVYQPKSINTKQASEFLEALKPDLFVVVAYGEILSEKILKIPKNFAINVHASLLPKYRGAAPINWAIINGETKTGITIIKMDEGLDTGAIILQRSVNIAEDDNAETLEAKLTQLGRGLLLEALENLAENHFSLTPQDESKGASPAPKFKKEDGIINWSKSASSIRNLIKGLCGWPNAFTFYRGKQLKIFKAKIICSDLRTYSPGEVTRATKEGILVAAGRDNLLIQDLQLEGKRRMKVEEFISGHKICTGEKLGNKN